MAIKVTRKIEFMQFETCTLENPYQEEEEDLDDQLLRKAVRMLNDKQIQKMRYGELPVEIFGEVKVHPEYLSELTSLIDEELLLLHREAIEEYKIMSVLEELIGP